MTNFALVIEIKTPREITIPRLDESKLLDEFS